MDSTLKWLYRVLGKNKGYIIALVAIQAVTGSLGVVYALLMRNIVDSAVAGEIRVFWHYVALIALFVAFQLAVGMLIRWLHALAGTNIENTLKKRLMQQILTRDYAAVSAVHSGEWMNRMTSDTAVVANGCLNILPGLVSTVVRLASALVMLIAIDKWYAYFLVPGGIALVLITYAFRKILKRMHKDIQEKDGQMRVFLQEHVGNLMMIKSFAAEKQTLAQAAEKMEAHKAARIRRNRFSNISSMGFSGAMHGMYLIGVVYSAYGIMHGTVTYGTLTAVMQLIGQVQSPFANISGYVPAYYAMIASAERLQEIERFEDDHKTPAYSAAQVRELYSDIKAVGVRHADFSYTPPTEGEWAAEQMPVVLKNMTLEIRKGEYVAFTGHSGCGKSTVLKLLMCMYPLDAGERYVAFASGKEEPLSAAWRRLFAYVPQGNALMSGKIRDIIAFSASEKSGDDAKIRWALTVACADEFVEDLDAVLGERGAGLSEGQMQRLAVARAIFSESPILLLDEATSALDEETEKKLLQNLRVLTDKTVVIVTHRAAALSICDRVLHFSEDGIEQV